MAYETLIKEAKELPEEKITEVLDFILFLKNQSANTAVQGYEKKQDIRRRPNIFAGKLKHIADDFDETPECFKEYMTIITADKKMIQYKEVAHLW